MANPSLVLSNLSSGQVRPLQLTAKDIAQNAHRELHMLGMNISPQVIGQMVEGMGLDSNDVGVTPSPLGGLTAGSIATPVQFLQEWLPGFVRVLTAARKIDELIGIATIGVWEDEEIVQGMIEPTGTAIPYTDYGNLTLSSWNAVYEKRTVVRFEQGFAVGLLEEARTARARISTAAEKRNSGALALDIQRNRVGFYGYNDGFNRTYGFLNDPSLLPAITAADGTSGSSKWSQKTFLEIVGDIRRVMSEIRTNSMDNIDPSAVAITFALATDCIENLTVVSMYGNSVREWAKENYPLLTFKSAPELNEAVGGENVGYAYPESVDDGSTDDGQTFIQMVPTKFISYGVEKRVKSYVEGFGNATAGVMLKRPFAVVRIVGI